MPIYFPSYEFTGNRPRVEMQMSADWAKITDTFEYQDGGRDYNEVADTAPIRWDYVVELPRTSAAEADLAASVYDNFYNSMRLSRPFYFVDKFGRTWTDVRIENYDRTHDEHKSWNVTCKFRLVSTTGNYIRPGVEQEWTRYDAGGAGDAANGWLASNGFSDGSNVTHSTALDTSGLTDPAPFSIYTTSRENSTSNLHWAVAPLEAFTWYKFRFHFFYGSATPPKNVYITANSRNVTSMTFEEAGKAYIREAYIKSDAAGQIALTFIPLGGSNSNVAGIEFKKEEPPADNNVTINILTEGDSITEGYPYFNDSWPKYFADSYKANYYKYSEEVERTGGEMLVRNMGFRSDLIAAIDAEASWEIDSYYDTDKKNVVIVHIGTNDVQAGTAAATIEAAIQSYCEDRRDAGWTVIASTIMPRTDNNAGKETVRLAVNTWLRANWQTFASRLVDFAASTKLDDATDTTYFVDGVHPSKAGSQVMATLVEAEVNALFDDTTRPGVPGTPALTPISNQEIDGTFTAPTDDVGVARYILRRSTASDFSENVVDTVILTTSFNATGLGPSTTYYFKVLAEDAAGNRSNWSNSSSESTSSATVDHRIDVGRNAGGTVATWDSSDCAYPANDNVYNTVRYDISSFTETVTGLTPSATYFVFVQSGWYITDYEMKVTINGVDMGNISRTAAADDYKIAEELYVVQADGSGNIAMVFSKVGTFALVSAIVIAH